MQIIEAELTEKTYDALNDVIRKIHRQENLLLTNRFDSLEERECSMSTLWEQATNYLEEHVMKIVEDRLESDKCMRFREKQLKEEGTADE